MGEDFDPRMVRLVKLICEAVHLAAEIGAPPDRQSIGSDRFLNRREAAEFLAVSPTTFDRMRRQGLVSLHHTIGRRGLRFSASELELVRQKLRQKGQ